MTTQRVLETLFWANWGSWDGRAERARLWDPELGRPSHVTITGESGAGKSTLMDGLTHLTQPGTVRYNQSAKRAGKGRAGDSRTTFDYVLGRYDTEVAANGVETLLTLRDRSRANVSYFGATWTAADDASDVVSACWFALLPPQGGPADLKECYVIADYPLDPASGVSAIGAGPLTPGVLKAAYPGALAYSSKGAYLAELRARLGTTEEAMRISDKILSGTTPSVADDLFHQLVFAEPSAPRRAAEAIATFDRYDEEWRSYSAARERIARLEEIDAAASEYEAARDESSLATRALDGAPGARPLDAWLDGVDARNVEEGLDELSGALASEEEAVARAEEAVAAADEAADRAQRAFLSSDGARLPEWRAELGRERDAADAARSARAQVEPLASALGIAMPADESAWDAMTGELSGRMPSYEAAIAGAQSDEDEAMAGLVRARDAVRAARAEVADYESRRTNVTRRMIEARRALSEAVGIPESRMPYVAELVDARRGQDGWRRAINDALGGSASLLLVSDDDFESPDEFRRMADMAADRLGSRVRFRFVSTGKPYHDPVAPRSIPSVTAIDESSPFAGYARHLVCEVADFRLASDVSELREPGAILPSGQTSERGGGAVGRGGPVIIGFSSMTALADARERLSEAEAAASGAQAALDGARAARHDAEGRLQCARGICRTTWASVDPTPHERRAGELEALIEKASDDDATRLLEAERDRTRKERDDAVAARAGAAAARGATAAAIGRLRRRAAALSRKAAAGLPAPGGDVADYLASQLSDMRGSWQSGWRASLPDEGGRAPVDDAHASLASRLQRRSRDLAAAMARASDDASARMRAYFRANPDSGLPGTDFDADLPAYRDELAELRRQRLDLPESLSERRLVSQTCQALADAVITYGEERKRLARQVREVSGLLAGRPYVGGGRVELSARASADDGGAAALHGRISALADAGIHAAEEDLVGDDDVSRLHAGLSKLVAAMRPAIPGDAPRGFDPRRAVEVRARICGPDGVAVSADSVGTRSGGESQTLMAFLTGAAMLYAQGATAGLPPYAPILMDEAFSIADREHTESAVRAILGLGFQLVCVVAENKEADFEQTSDYVYGVSKDASHRARLSAWKALR